MKLNLLFAHGAKRRFVVEKPLELKPDKASCCAIAVLQKLAILLLAQSQASDWNFAPRALAVRAHPSPMTKRRVSAARAKAPGTRFRCMMLRRRRDDEVARELLHETDTNARRQPTIACRARTTSDEPPRAIGEYHGPRVAPLNVSKLLIHLFLGRLCTNGRLPPTGTEAKLRVVFERIFETFVSFGTKRAEAVDGSRVR